LASLLLEWLLLLLPLLPLPWTNRWWNPWANSELAPLPEVLDEPEEEEEEE
jgi:hypothetical protein